MTPDWILYPLFAMFLLTLLVSLRTLQLRYRAVLRDGLPAGYFRHNRGGKPPGYLLQAEQHYNNLFETPVLFYAVVLVAFITQQVDQFGVILAWCYVLTRLAHAWIHLGKNNVLQRRNIFIVSTLLLTMLWGYTFVRLMLA